MGEPIFVEFAGLPAAGKTTVAAGLAALLAREGIYAEVVAEPGLRSPLQHAKRRLAFNVWTMCETVTTVIEKSAQTSASIVILDRGLVDAMAWLRWHQNVSQAAAAACEVALRFAAVEEWFARERIVWILFADYDTAQRRRGEQQPGTIVNPETISALGEAYREVAESLRFRSRLSVYDIDTNARTPAEVLAIVARSMPLMRDTVRTRAL